MDRSERDAADQQFLQGFLAARDEPCPLCDYNLRGLTGDHCPECGRELMLRVVVQESGVAAYMFGLVGLAIQFGFTLLVLALLFSWMIFRDSHAVMPLWMLIPAMALSSGVLLLIWIRNASRIRRQSRTVRNILAIFCLLAPVVGVLIVIYSWGTVVKN